MLVDSIVIATLAFIAGFGLALGLVALLNSLKIDDSIVYQTKVKEQYWKTVYGEDDGNTKRSYW